jgi:hypothetical protein
MKRIAILVLLVLTAACAVHAAQETHVYYRTIKKNGDSSIQVDLEDLHGNVQIIEQNNAVSGNQIVIEASVNADELDEVEVTVSGPANGDGTILVRARALEDDGDSSSSSSLHTGTVALTLTFLVVLVALQHQQQLGSGSSSSLRYFAIFAVALIALAALPALRAGADDRVDVKIWVPSGTKWNMVDVNVDKNGDVKLGPQIVAKVVRAHIHGDGDVDGHTVSVEDELTATVDGDGHVRFAYLSGSGDKEADVTLTADKGDVQVHLVEGSYKGTYELRITTQGTVSAEAEDDSIFTVANATNGVDGTIGTKSDEANGAGRFVIRVADGLIALWFAKLANSDKAALPNTPLPVAPPQPVTTTPAPTTPAPPPPPPPGDNQLVEADFFCTLKEDDDLWTQPLTRRVHKDQEPPSNECARSGVYASAIRNEYEPILIVHKRSGGSATVSVSGLAGLEVKLFKAVFDAGDLSDGLEPFSSGDSVSLSGSRPTPILLDVYVPADASMGTHSGTVNIGGTSIGITVHVFNTPALPITGNFYTQHNINGVSEDEKTMLLRHRITPKGGITWPTGFKYTITWDSSSNPKRCDEFYDEPDESACCALHLLAPKFIRGEGWIGDGFPSAMLFQFVDNSTPRPSSFCGVSRSDGHYGGDTYNDAWLDYIGALEQYLIDHDYIDKTYHYVQNEPQDQDDLDLAAYLCSIQKARAPRLRLAISEEPRFEIAENAENPCGYDIWIAHVKAWRQDYAWKRVKDHGEQVWFYTLPQDADPLPNPVNDDRQGIHTRIYPWISWTLRVQGYAYYDSQSAFFNTVDGDMVPTTRGKLLRESYEDYEYLFRIAGDKHGVPSESNPADAAAASVAQSRTSWTQNVEALAVLRHELGRYLGGERSTVPQLVQSCNGARDSGSYYISFQDPSGEPSAEPLVIDSKTHIKMGWQAYDEDTLTGWLGENVDTSIAKTGFDSSTQSSAGISSFSLAQRSYIYDDNGRLNTFQFGIANGNYRVSYSIGRPAKGYSGDPHNLVIEGNVVAKDYVTTNEAPVLVGSVDIVVNDCTVTAEVGGFSDLANNFAYTFISYLYIEPR